MFWSRWGGGERWGRWRGIWGRVSSVPPVSPPVPLARVYLGGVVLGWKGEGGGGEVVVPAKGLGDAEEMVLWIWGSKKLMRSL